MAYLDNADCLSRCKLLAGRPATDTATTDAQWYNLLSDAQAVWTNNFAAQVPWVLMGAPVLLTSADSGLTYTFPNGIVPLAVELFDSQSTTGRILKPSSYWDANGDYVWEGATIRFPQNQQITYSGGPYARFVTPPGAIDGSTQPTLVPTHCRLLLVYRAVAEWATRGGLRDPSPFYDLERRFWYGNPASGDVGVLGALKMANPFYGATAMQENFGGPLDGVSTGSGYTVLRLGGG